MAKIEDTFWELSIENYGSKIESQSEFYKIIKTADKGVKDFVFWPKSIIPTSKAESIIKDIKFSDCSFAFTSFENITFYNCTFFNCKFNHSAFKNCKVHDCTFTYVNMFKTEISETYVDPDSFKKIIPNFKNPLLAVRNANMCVAFFQTLFNNCKETGQEIFENNADYHFKKWKGINYIQRKFVKSPFLVKISWKTFLKKFTPNLLQYLITGYGHKIENFLATFIIGFVSFFFLNKYYWVYYCLQKRDVQIDNFNSELYNSYANFVYTFDSITKLIDSQIQPTSELGMWILVIQGIFGFLLLSSLFSIISNKFIK